jgi:hypothetical protein
VALLFDLGEMGVGSIHVHGCFVARSMYHELLFYSTLYSPLQRFLNKKKYLTLYHSYNTIHTHKLAVIFCLMAFGLAPMTLSTTLPSL